MPGVSCGPLLPLTGISAITFRGVYGRLVSARRLPSHRPARCGLRRGDGDAAHLCRAGGRWRSCGGALPRHRRAPARVRSVRGGLRGAAGRAARRTAMTAGRSPPARQTAIPPCRPLNAGAAVAAAALVDDLDVLRLGSLLALRDVELDLLPFVEAAVAATSDRAEVHEHIRATFNLDEAVAFVAVEPLHRALRHLDLLRSG